MTFLIETDLPILSLCELDRNIDFILRLGRFLSFISGGMIAANGLTAGTPVWIESPTTADRDCDGQYVLMAVTKPIESVYQLKITLLGIRATIWRRIQVPNTILLSAL